MTDSEKAFSRIKNNLPQYGTFDHGYQSTEDLIVVSNALQRSAECEKENKILKNKLTMAEYAEVQEMLRADIKELEDKSQGLVTALKYCAQEPDKMHPLQNMPHVVAREAIAAFKADETEEARSR